MADQENPNPYTTSKKGVGDKLSFESDEPDVEEISGLGQAIMGIGCALGIAAGCALLWVSPITGAIPGMFFGVGGAVLGGLIAKPIALAVSKRG